RPAAQAPAQVFGRGRGRGPAPAPAEATPAPAPASNSLARFAQYEQLKRALEAARGGTGRGAPAARRDRTGDFLGKVLKGEVALRIEAHREDDLRNALRLA